MELVFYIAGAVAVISTILMVTRLNVVHALLYLIVSLLAVAVVFYVLGAPFVAALEVTATRSEPWPPNIVTLQILKRPGPGEVSGHDGWLQPLRGAKRSSPTSQSIESANDLSCLASVDSFSRENSRFRLLLPGVMGQRQRDAVAEFPCCHAVIRSDTEPVTRDGVARAWRATLHQAQEWEFTSLTVPPIGTGAGNLSVEDAAEIMVPILKTHLGNAAFPASVSIVVETAEERDAFEAVLRRSGAAES